MIAGMMIVGKHGGNEDGGHGECSAQLDLLRWRFCSSFRFL